MLGEERQIRLLHRRSYFPMHAAQARDRGEQAEPAAAGRQGGDGMVAQERGTVIHRSISCDECVRPSGQLRRRAGHDGRQATALAPFQRAEQGGARRWVGRLDEDLDRPVAAEAVAPHRVVIGAQVEELEPWRAIDDHLSADPLHIALQAAAGDVADRRATRAHEQTRTGLPIRGAGDAHDRGQRHPLGACRVVPDRHEDLAQLAHRSRL